MKVNSLSVSDVQKLIAQTDEYRAHYYKYTPARNGKTPRITTCLWTLPVSALMAQ